MINRYQFLGVQTGTRRTQDSLDPKHFGIGLVGLNCPETSIPVPKCPKDSSDLSNSQDGLLNTILGRL